jgi:hypothetical protein
MKGKSFAANCIAKEGLRDRNGFAIFGVRRPRRRFGLSEIAIRVHLRLILHGGAESVLLCEAMKKRTRPDQRSSTLKAKKATKPNPSREFIESLRGKYRGQGLMKKLMAEKKRARDL